MLQDPGCPVRHPELWNGYSLLHIEDDSRSHVQDLGTLKHTH